MSRWRGVATMDAGRMQGLGVPSSSCNLSCCPQQEQVQLLPSTGRLKSAVMPGLALQHQVGGQGKQRRANSIGIRAAIPHDLTAAARAATVSNRSLSLRTVRHVRAERISPVRTSPRSIPPQRDGPSPGTKRISVWECRTVASDIGGYVSDNAFDVAKVPLLEVLASERAKVLFLLAHGMALCNAVRVVMSIAILPMAASYGWSTSFGGVVQSSFLWGYLISPIPGGILVDRYGGKVVMAWGVAAWSLATMLTPWAANHSMAMLLAVRVLMGVAEGVAMPCMNNMLCKWFPRWERARAVGLTMAGFHLGSVVALLVSPALLRNYGLSGPFWVFGLLGFAWLALWCPHVSKDPQSSQQVASSEFSYISSGQDHLQGPKQSVDTKLTGTNNQNTGYQLPFNTIFSKLPTWAIIVANFMNNWGYFVLLSWMPVYFSTVLGVNLQQAAWFSAAPWAVMAVAGFAAGACSDYLIHLDISITAVRKIMQSVGFLGPALALLQLNSVTDPTVASLWLTAALGLSAFSQAGFLVNHQEIAPRYAGFLHGVSNSAGTVAAIASTVGTGFFIERLGSFQAFLTLTSMLYVLGTLFWNCTASGERVIF